MNPAGPKGRFHLLNSISHSIFDFSPVKEEARAFMRWLMEPKQLGGWYAIADSYYQPLLHGYDTAPMWNVEPRNLPFRDALANAHLPGWPAPASRQLAESVAKYVVVDMFAKACAGCVDQGRHQGRRDPTEGHLSLGLTHDDCFRASPRTCPSGAPACVACGVCSTAKSVFSWLMMALPLAFLAALVGYPFFYGILLSLEDRPVAHTGTFVGLKNFVHDAHDPVFWRAAINTFVYTIVATLLKMVGGLGLALAMNQHFRMKNLVRALLLLPFIVPTVLSTVAWLWMLDPAFSVVNRMLVALGWPKPGPSWLGDPTLAMVSIIIINTWRGLPFYGITLLAGLQTVPAELYEAASIDGAGGWERFRFITLPMLRPIILIVTLFSVIFTFADFQLVYVLTHGGPANATQLFATYAFDIAMGAGQLGLGASVALAMLPALALLIVALTIYLRRE